MDVRIFEVGGSIRDELLGLPTKDRDFAVVLEFEGIKDPLGVSAAQGFTLMRDHLVKQGFNIFLETPEFLTIRAHFPKGHEQFGKTTADFVLARVDGPSTDGRRPDWVRVGTLEDDLRRRDFTINALAREVGNTNIIDLHRGIQHLKERTLVTVGLPEDRLREDALRALRALRFSVVKDFGISDDLWAVLRSDWLPPLLSSVSQERMREELFKMFHHDTHDALTMLWMFPGTMEVVFADRLWLKPTMED